nr:hypothetical protein [Tanacetum cinerariifolium]
FTALDTQSIKQGADFFVVKGKFTSPLLDRPETIQSQLDVEFLQLLIQYNSLLRQRNATLKQQPSGSHGFDIVYLQALDDQLAPLGERLSALRAGFLTEFTPVFQSHYQQLAEGREVVTLEYKSQLPGQNFRHLLLANERRDLAMQRSNVGPHRDDFIFLMDDLPVKSYASQGQQKSFVIALKLAQFELLARRPQPTPTSNGASTSKPLLLLDDIFDRLDDRRIARLLQLVADHTFGQVFITDTSLARTDQALTGISSDIRRFRVQAGSVTLI